MIDENSNLSNDEIENKLKLLWSNYANKFNNVETSSFSEQSNLLDDILTQIRTLENLKKG